jgi:SAM-dependent methyltransferase
MATPAERDYVLGTHDSEIERLGLQHRVWRPTVLDCWRRAGIATGSRVLDVGCGPGFATVDLAEVVGPSGAVVAVERSARFAQFARTALAGRGLSQVRLHELDLMADPLPGSDFDAVWCRWVASFVSSPATLVEKIASALRVGGRAVFHEYVDYGSWRLVPTRRLQEEFVQRVMASWRESGGEPDAASALPRLLASNGVKVIEATPRVFCVRPGNELWQWPASFIRINLDRLSELGLADGDWVTAVRQEFQAAEDDPDSLMITPMVLELIAERRP